MNTLVDTICDSALAFHATVAVCALAMALCTCVALVACGPDYD